MRVILFLLSLGILTSSCANFLPNMVGLGLLSLAIITLIILGYTKFNCCILFAVFLIGNLLGFYRGVSVIGSLLPNDLEGIEIEINGYINELPQIHENRTTFYLSNVSMVGKTFNGVIKLNWYNAPTIKPGQYWRFMAKLKRPRAVSTPGRGDYELVLLRQNIIAIGYVTQSKSAQMISESIWNSHYLRWWIASWIKHNSHSKDTAAIINALLIGDKTDISQSNWSIFNISGVTHLLVISGLHIGLIAWLGYLLSRLLAYLGFLNVEKWPLPRVSAVLGLAFSIVYAFLAGFSVPVQRALIMLATGLGALLLDRTVKPSTLWLVAITAVLVWDPLAGFNRGFWLSFIAVAALLYGLSKERFEKKHIQLYKPFSIARIKHNLFRLLKAQWVVSCTLWPCLALAMQPVSVLSFLINLISIPLLTLVVIPLLIFSITTVFIYEPVALSLLHAVHFILRNWLQSLQWLIDSGVGISELPSPSLPSLFFALIGIFFLLSPRGIGIRGLVLPCCLPWFLSSKALIANGRFTLNVIDVGNSVSVLVSTRNHTLIYGSAIQKAGRNSFSSIENTVTPFLKKQYIKKVNTWVFPEYGFKPQQSNGHFAQKFNVEQVISPTVKSQHIGRVPSLPCNKVESWQWDGVQFRFVNAAGDPNNDMACVLQITDNANKSALLISSLSDEEMCYLLDDSQLKSDVLVVGGIDAFAGLSDLFLNRLQVKTVLVSAGFRYRFPYPSFDTIHNLSQRNILIKTTRDYGTITCNAVTDCVGYRETGLGYWPKQIADIH